MLNWDSKKEGRMARQKHTVEQIISKLRQAEVELSQGRTRGEVCRSLGVTEQTYYRWRKEYGGLQMDQAKRWKEVEQENTRLRKAVAELTLDKLILKEAARGKLLSPARRRQCVARVREARSVSERRVLGQARSTQRHPAVPGEEEDTLTRTIL
jgi:putative transposase